MGAQPTPPFLGSSFPADLKQYLKLADAEVAFILKSNSDYNRTYVDNETQVSQLQAKIATETQKDPLDPQALGTYYAGIELIRRDLANQLTGLVANLRASLDDAQRGQLNTLASTRDLAPLISEAQCESLLDPIASILPGNVIPVLRVVPISQPTTGGLTGYFPTSSCYIGDFPTDLQQYLGLSTGQASAITNLNTANERKVGDDQQMISHLQVQIVQETAKDPLDPQTLGSLYAQIETIRRNISSDQATLRKSAQAVLNDMQQVKLKSLDDARKQQPLINEATCQNLLSAPVGSAPVGLTGLPVASFLLGSGSLLLGSGSLAPTLPAPLCGSFALNLSAPNP